MDALVSFVHFNAKNSFMHDLLTSFILEYRKMDAVKGYFYSELLELVLLKVGIFLL